MSELDKWREYAKQKKLLTELNLPSDEYEQAIQELCERLGI